MAYKLMGLVQRARLPKNMKRRPETKAILMALAYFVPQGEDNAFPSVRTLADASEVGEKQAAWCLAEAQRRGWITEVRPPSQHRPRTWRINVEALEVLATPNNRAPQHSHVAPHDHADLSAVSAPHDPAALTHDPDPQICAPETQIGMSDPQICAPAPHDHADDLLISLLNEGTSAHGRPAGDRSLADQSLRAEAREHPAQEEKADGKASRAAILDRTLERLAAKGKQINDGDLCAALRCESEKHGWIISDAALLEEVTVARKRFVARQERR